MRKVAIVSVLVALISITVSHAQTNITGVSRQQTEQKEKLSNLMKHHVVGWNYVDEGDRWYKWGNNNPIYEYKTFSELYPKSAESYQSDVPTKVYAGSIFIGNDIVVITSSLETFNKYYSDPDNGRTFSIKYIRNGVSLKTDKVRFLYATNSVGDLDKYKVYNDDPAIVKEIMDFLKVPNNMICIKTADLNLKTGFVAKAFTNSDFEKPIYSYNYPQISTEVLDVVPKTTTGETNIGDYIQSKISDIGGWTKDAYCKVNARFIIETDGSVSNLVLEGGDFFTKPHKIIEEMWYYAPTWIEDAKIDGFNNQVAKVISSTKFVPGKKNGKPVRTYCAYEISHVVSVKFGSTNNDIDDDKVYTEVDVMPEFPGGQQALYKYLGNNLRVKVEGTEEALQGRVFVNFIIEKDGSISNVKVVKGADGCEACNKEAVRVVSSMPKWSPGKHHYNPVRVSFTIPISFRAQ